MRKAALALVAVALSMCFGLWSQEAQTLTSYQAARPVQMTTVRPGSGSNDTSHVSKEVTTRRSNASDERGPVSADITDSDQFYQSAIRGAGTKRDNTQRIESLLKRMTLEEKVGQMTQLQIGMVTNGHDQEIQIDPAKLEKAVGRYGVGSILNVSDQALTVDKWQEIIRQIQEAAKKTRLRIPVIYGIDSIHGANYVYGATLFP